MNTILFVINPISGGIDKTRLKGEIESYCRECHLSCKIFETTGKNDHERIQEHIRKEACQTLVACGGDGTVNLVARVSLESNTALGIIPLGSANGLAKELMIPKNIKKAIEVIRQNRIINMDVLRINHKHISLHLSDMGFNAKLIKNFDEAGFRGSLGYAMNFFKVLFKKAPQRYTFSLNDKYFQKRAEMVVFANASQYGTGAVVNPDGQIDDGKFEVCIFKPYPWYAIFRLTFDFFTGRMNRSPYVRIHSTNHINIKAKRPETLQIDGEVVGDFKEVTASLHDKSLKIIVPQEYK